MTPLAQASVLVVDDEEMVQATLVRLLTNAGCGKISTASSGDEARTLLAAEEIDLILTDMQMPGGSGIELLTHVHDTMPTVATLMVTGVDDADLANKALALGAYGYIIKPFRQSEVLIGVSNALRRRHLEIENMAHRDRLEETVKERTADLWAAIVKLENAEKDVLTSRTETIERLAVAGEFRDEDTGFHVARMSKYCEILARAAGEDELTATIREASCLHDVGKIGVPDGILLKPGPLLPDERTTMEKHAEIGYSILSGSASPLLNLAAEIAVTHHERFDGAGYPNQLVGEAIPLAGRMAGIADVFDALTSNRVYRKAFPLMKAVEMMKEEAGAHFDPDLLSIFWDVLPEVLAIELEVAA
ncbi:MAG: cyclic di-GMP phosphodiesterase [Actinomycetota bacterium]|jgi:putative two-component system response regulator|nr:cyclic di-GMP phosphodiesterase [Actinomycetota bacterium]